MDINDVVYSMRRNKLVRVIYAPIALAKRAYQSSVFPKSEDSKFLASIKDSHKGERCFIVGNGPSLTIDDLESLKNEYCFGMNRIYYLFNKTQWRPSMYVSFDLDVIAKEAAEVNALDLPCRMYNLNAKKYLNQDPRNHYFFLKGKYKINRAGTGQTTVNEDLTKFMTLTDNVTGVCLQLAYYMGFQDIYLIGIDHNYPVKGTKGGGSGTNYFAGMKGNVKPDFNVDAVNQSYQTLRNYADAHGIHVFNATRGGKLEIFERVSLDEVVGDKK